ncbi:MAG: tetratricopeptide repeat protein [Pirellulales bacterium]|nr:tetratricopeptide repeat protein [Pirellulales bacterium]
MQVKRIQLRAALLSLALLFLGLGCRETQPSSVGSPSAIPAVGDRGEPAATAIPQVTSTNYIGSEACVECHQEITDQYRGHSMGRSLAPVMQAEPVGPAKGSASDTPGNKSFVAGGFRYEVLEREGKVFHRQSRVTDEGAEMAVIEQEVHYAVGSGQHGRSYLANRDGYLFLSPITWYPEKGIWDLSPGFEKVNSQFNRPVIESCLFCHSHRPLHVPHTANRYSDPVFDGHAIGCERCHGPGRQHVQKHREGQVIDAGADEIVNPAHLPPRLREAVCQQCHLSGVARVLQPGCSLQDFRPGQPLESCFSTFVLRPDTSKENPFVGQVEQMVASRCFQASDGKLGCISCHDPHGLPAPEARIEFYRNRCLRCHATDACDLDETARQKAADNSCMACHMPRRDTEVQHAAMVDHRIPRHGAEALHEKPASQVDSLAMPIVRFGSTLAPPLVDRDLAIALMMATDSLPKAMRSDLQRRALTTLEQVARDDPDDLPAHEYLGQAYLAEGRAREAITVLDHVLRRQPGREVSLAVMADLIGAMGDHGQAIQYWKRAIDVNPWMSRYWYGLAKAHDRSGQWMQCQETARQAVLRFPTSMGARHLLVESYLRLGQPARAEEAFEWILRYKPRGLDALSKWYESHPLRR